MYLLHLGAKQSSDQAFSSPDASFQNHDAKRDVMLHRKLVLQLLQNAQVTRLFEGRQLSRIHILVGIPQRFMNQQCIEELESHGLTFKQGFTINTLKMRVNAHTLPLHVFTIKQLINAKVHSVGQAERNEDPCSVEMPDCGWFYSPKVLKGLSLSR